MYNSQKDALKDSVPVIPALSFTFLTYFSSFFSDVRTSNDEEYDAKP